MTSTDAAVIVERLGRLDSCVVSDALDAVGGGAVVDHLRPMWEGARLVGRAVTMALATGPVMGSKVHLGVRAIERATAIDTIVVANEGRSGMGSWGGLLSVAASARGVAGVVTDGALRDVDEARDLRFPVFARGATPRTARGRAHEVSCGEPVEIAGVPVSPGDLVLADGTGVVVVRWESAEDVLTKAEELAQREAEMGGRLRGGRTASAVLDTAYESMVHAQAGGGAER